jgi:hypothetical protein
MKQRLASWRRARARAGARALARVVRARGGIGCAVSRGAACARCGPAQVRVRLSGTAAVAARAGA